MLFLKKTRPQRTKNASKSSLKASHDLSESLLGLFAKDIEKSSQVETCEYQAYFRTRSLNPSFGRDIILPPLPFDDSISMFYNGLSFLVGLGV